MAAASRIEWTDATWNPIRARNLVTGKLGWHCTHVSEGCRYCYAEPINRRLGTGLDFKPQLLSPPPGGQAAPAARGASGARVEVFLDEAMLRAPLKWKKPRRIFVGSMSDLFGEFVTDAMLDRIFAVMALCPQHTFQVLTKRAARQRAYMVSAISGERTISLAAHELTHGPITGPVGHVDLVWTGAPLPNVWHGVSAEDQASYDERIGHLIATPAARTFLSAEPLLGPINLGWAATEPASSIDYFQRCGVDNVGGRGRLDWVIAGGESGPHARPMHPDWARQIRDACAAAGTAFFFKQWGEWREAAEGDVFDTAKGNAGKPPALIVHPRDGTVHCFMPREERADYRAMLRVGKKATGRLLDGEAHNAMPAVR